MLQGLYELNIHLWSFSLEEQSIMTIIIVIILMCLQHVRLLDKRKPAYWDKIPLSLSRKCLRIGGEAVSSQQDNCLGSFQGTIYVPHALFPLFKAVKTRPLELHVRQDT